MDPKTLAIEAGIALARFLWHKVHGADTKPDEAAIRAAGIKAAQMTARAAALEIERRAAEVGITAASDTLAHALASLSYELGRVETDPSPDVPRILDGVDIEIVDALPPAPVVETVGPLDSDDIVTKPGTP